MIKTRFRCVLIALCMAAVLCSCGQTQEDAITVYDEPAPSPMITTPSPEPEPTQEPVEALIPRDDELVRVKDYIPDIAVDLRYATAENFTGSVIYDFEDAWLRYGTVKKLRLVQEQLYELGYGLLIWDAYRPASAQYLLWDAMPDATYVANPYRGYSSHSSGGTVDIALIGLNGTSVEMPSGFDEFSTLADRDYSDASDSARENALLLEGMMTEAGFSAYYGEWWHFTDLDGYGYADVAAFVPPHSAASRYVPDCEEYISLRAAADYGSETADLIYVDEEFTVCGYWNGFVRVEYNNRQGYVVVTYIKPLV